MEDRLSIAVKILQSINSNSEIERALNKLSLDADEVIDSKIRTSFQYADRMISYRNKEWD